jgi:DNA-binding CsgD family transcriptional regulator
VLLLKKIDLSVREQDVLALASRGLTDKEIALELSISQSTVKSYWVRIRQKTGGYNRTEAVANTLNQSTGAAAEKADDRLLRHLAKQMAVSAYVDGYIVDESGTVILAIGSVPGEDPDLAEVKLPDALQLEEKASILEAIRGVARDLRRRSLVAFGPCRRGIRVSMKLDILPTALDSGANGAVVTVTRPKVKPVDFDSGALAS